jgi:hypothetical protein
VANVKVNPYLDIHGVFHLTVSFLTSQSYMGICLLFFFGAGNQKAGKMSGSGGKSEISGKFDFVCL